VGTAAAALPVPFARVDHHRAARHGYPEVVFCQGKTPEQVVAVCRRLAARGDGFLATRADEAVRAALAAALRRQEPPIVGRIEDDMLLLDLRAVDPGQDQQLAEGLARALEAMACTS
ncbi:MAG: hypothetical protein LOD91_09210, partial [Limnochordales bacterium]